jgi:hypothetical protein
MLTVLFTILGATVIALTAGRFLILMLQRLLALRGNRAKTVAALPDEPKGLVPVPGVPALRPLILGLVGGLLVMALQGAFFYAEPGYSYLVQYPWGTQVSELTPGYHLRYYGNVLPFKKVLTVGFTDDPGSSFTALRAPLNNVRFNDAVVAEAVFLVNRFRLPEDPVKFRQLAVDFRSQTNLVTSAFIPFAGEVTRNSARMLPAQDFISGRGGEFEAAVFEQMQHGIYVLETRQLRRTASGELSESTSQIDEASILDDERTIARGEITRMEVSKVLGSDGLPVRKPHPFSAYGILVEQATVENVDFESGFKERIKDQRDQAALAALEREKARRAEFERQRVVAEGETEKALTRVAQEKEQIIRVVAAETKRKEEDELLKAARLEAVRIETLANAEASKRRSLMAADNALEMRLDALVKIAGYQWQAVRDGQIPLVPVYVGGGSGDGQGTSVDLMNLLTINAAKQVGVDLETGSK